MSDVTASPQLEAVARIMKIAALNGEKRFIDHANQSYLKVLHTVASNPSAYADHGRRQIRLLAVQRELIELQSVPLRTTLV
jgi:hypothetical protein